MRRHNFKDMTGQTFGRLVVLGTTGRRPRHGREFIWECRCQCGNACSVRGSHLREGRTQSCGCFRRERGVALGKRSARHGLHKSPTYSSWRMMIQRCTNPKTICFSQYGAQGVKVCERWKVFDNFLSDLGLRPEGKTLGRILDIGDYAVGNAFWMTTQEQMLNRRNKRALLKWGTA
jgi:hypothetical protein